MCLAHCLLPRLVPMRRTQSICTKRKIPVMYVDAVRGSAGHTLAHLGAAQLHNCHQCSNLARTGAGNVLGAVTVTANSVHLLSAAVASPNTPIVITHHRSPFRHMAAVGLSSPPRCCAAREYPLNRHLHRRNQSPLRVTTTTPNFNPRHIVLWLPAFQPTEKGRRDGS